MLFPLLSTLSLCYSLFSVRSAYAIPSSQHARPMLFPLLSKLGLRYSLFSARSAYAIPSSQHVRPTLFPLLSTLGLSYSLFSAPSAYAIPSQHARPMPFPQCALIQLLLSFRFQFNILQKVPHVQPSYRARQCRV